MEPGSLPPGWLAAGLAALVFVAVAYRLARQGGAGMRRWAWRVLLFGLVAGRAGHVLAAAGAYAADPLAIVMVWQGGFAPWAGALGVLVATVPVLRRNPDAIGPVVAALAAGCIAWSLIAPVTRIGTAPAIPDLALAGLEGGAMAAGQPMVVNLWATWCPPCRREMPMMTRVAAETGDVAFVFANQGETEAAVRRFIEAQNLPAQDMFLDPAQRLMGRYRAFGLPTTVFVGADGQVRRIHAGEISRDALQDGIDLLR